MGMRCFCHAVFCFGLIVDGLDQMNRVDLNTILIFVLPFVAGFLVWYIQRSITTKATNLANERALVAEERRAAIALSHEQVLTRLTVLEKQGTADSQTLALLKQEMLPMAEALKRKLVDILTHPSDHFKFPDALLKKVRKRGAEMPAELLPLLKERETSTDPHVTEQEKLAAEALPIIVRLAELEAQEESSAEITGVQLVTSTAKTKETKAAEEGKAKLPDDIKDLIVPSNENEE